MQTWRQVGMNKLTTLDLRRLGRGNRSLVLQRGENEREGFCVSPCVRKCTREREREREGLSFCQVTVSSLMHTCTLIWAAEDMT